MVNEIIAVLIGVLIGLVVAVKLVAWALLGLGRLLKSWIEGAL